MEKLCVESASTMLSLLSFNSLLIFISEKAFCATTGTWSLTEIYPNSLSTWSMPSWPRRVRWLEPPFHPFKPITFRIHNKSKIWKRCLRVAFFRHPSAELYDVRFQTDAQRSPVSVSVNSLIVPLQTATCYLVRARVGFLVFYSRCGCGVHFF